MGKGTTRPYEVPVVIVPTTPSEAVATEKRIYLVDATSKGAAFAHVAAKFVGEPVLANGKRVAALMSQPNNVKLETANVQSEPSGGTE